LGTRAKRLLRRGAVRTKRRSAPARRRERLVHEGIEQFRLAQAALGIVTWIWDTGTNRIQWYGDVSRILGLAPKSFSGAFGDYLKQVHPEDVAAAKSIFIDCLKGRTPEYRTAERVIWPDGSVHWLETYGRAEQGRNGRTVRMLGVIKEITERKRQESARQKAEALLSQVFAASPDYIVIVRVDDGMFLAANPAFERVTGYRAEEIVGRSVAELNIWAIPGERERFVAELRKSGSLENRHVLLRKRDGSMVSGRISASLIEHEGERLIISLMHDITEAKRLERRASQSERKYAALFETSPVGLVVTRPRERRILEINDAALRIVGVEREQAIGALTTDIVSWDDLEQLAQYRTRALAGESMGSFTANFTRRDGKRMEAVISSALIELEGEPHFVISLLDVTEQRRIERERQQAESKYSALFASNPEAIIITRVRDALILAVNAAWERYSGYRRDAVLGRSAFDLRSWVRAEDRAAVVARLEAEGSVSNFETRFLRADGAQIEVLLSAARIEIDGETCAIWSWRDVSDLRETERRARQAERKFAALFENSPEPISLMRLSDQVRLAANGAWERVTGHSRERASSRPATAMSMWRDPARRTEVIARVASAGGVTQLEERLVRADGSEFDALISGVCIELDGERCILWTWRDVSEQRRVERERTAADARYRALFETALDGFVIGTPQNTVIDANPAALAMTGYSREELAGLHVSKLFRPEELAARPLRQDLGKRWSAIERVLARKDGGTLAVEVVAGPMPDGNVLAMMRDITERKRNETLLMNVARGVSAELGDAFFRSLSEHLARELGADFAFVGELVPPDNSRMRTLALLADGAIVPNDEIPVHGSMSAQVLAKRGTVVFAEGVMERFPDNQEMKRHAIQAYVGTPLYGADGAPLGVLAVAHRQPVERGQFWASMIEIFGARAAAEIERARAEALVRRTNESLEQTVRERTGQLEDANQELESYNFSISHDLRQPLNAIAGFADLLRDQVSGEMGAAAQECVSEIESNAHRMEQMIESLLRLSRAGRGELRKEEVDARALVDDVLRGLASSEALGAEVTVGELPAAQGDPVLLRQVWANLVGNAVKYSRKNAAPRVEISGACRDGAVEYVVRDNGVGFDMRYAERLFGTFQRLPSSKGFEGSGVGLAIVQRIVRRHGGSISGESAPGEGATFRFTLPDIALK
jgi:PAS domain S-box-containing protein